MPSNPRHAILYLPLALVFTVGLTFASLELPYLLDSTLQEMIATPDGDSHASPVQRVRTELFIEYYHLRVLGYACFVLTLLLIVLGFATRHSAMATIGAVAFMLPVFAQFAGVMFFLAGLGILNLLWLPVLDISFDIQHLGLIIRAPFDLTMWLFRLVGVNAYWPVVIALIGGGLLIFLLGTLAWLTARVRGEPVADFWVYKVSRHPQYLGWMLWTYGLFLLLMRSLYPKRSWGIDASLSWLLSTMVIVGVALIEEITMRRRFGGDYDRFRSRTPFMFPVPRPIGRLLRWPFRMLFHKEWPEQSWEVASVLSLYTAVLVGASALFYGGGMRGLARVIQSEEAQRGRVEEVYTELREEGDSRKRRGLARDLAAFGDLAVPYLVRLLHDEEAGLRQHAAEQLGKIGSPAAVEPLVDALADQNRNVRFSVMGALQGVPAPAAKAPLLALATDPDPLTRRVARRTLASQGFSEVIPLLLQELGDSLAWSRVGAVEDLGNLRAESAVPALITELAGENPLVRRAVVVSLLQIGSPQAREALRGALSDEDWEVRMYAAEALDHLASAPEEN